jgi:hypothetical protein
MLTDGDINAAIRHLADAFLDDIRTDKLRKNRSGWGQYLRSTSRQIGLYGTCSGIICIALAHGGERVPDVVTQYVNDLWNTREQTGSEGAKNFSLTARCAFLVLALRLANDQRLRSTQEAVTQELLSRINSDGLFKPWQIGQSETSHASSEVATSIALLAFTLAPGGHRLSDDLIGSAKALQNRLEQPRSSNEGVQQLILLAAVLALGTGAISKNLQKRLARTEIHVDGEGQDTLDFWDYSWRNFNDLEQRRDYMHVPSMAIELLLASATQLSNKRREKAMMLAKNVADKISSQCAFYDGREIATSKSQAWIALALNRSKQLIAPPPKTNWMSSALRRLLNSVISQ